MILRRRTWSQNVARKKTPVRTERRNILILGILRTKLNAHTQMRATAAK